MNASFAKARDFRLAWLAKMTAFGFLLAGVALAFTTCCLAQQPMRFETPKMNEEEQHSMHIPGSFEMQCDACTAVAYQVGAWLLLIT